MDAKEINQKLALHIAKKCFDNYIKDRQSTQKTDIDKYAEIMSDAYLEAYKKLKELITD